MRILYLFANYNSMMYQWQKYHIFDEMKQHDCSFDIISPSDFDNTEQLNETIISKVKNNHYDIFLTSYNENVIDITTIELIKKCGVATVLFCPDNLVDPFRHKRIASKFDLVWLTSKETEYLFKRWGANTIFLPYAANPNFLKGDIPRDDIPRVGFIGTPHGSRVANINKLLERGIPLTVHSKKNDTSNAVFRASGKEYIKVIKDYIKYPIGRKLLCGAVLDKLGKNEVDLYNPNLVLKDPVPLSELANANSSFALTLSFTAANSTGVLKHPVWKHIGISLFRVLSGFLLAFIAAIPVALLMGWYKSIRSVFEPWVQFIRCIPPIAYLPLVIVAVGVGEGSKITVIFIGSFLVMLVTIYQGVLNVDETLIKAGKVLGASDREIFFTVVVPASLPFIMTALRLGLATALTSLVAAEMTGASDGLGVMIQTASQYFQMTTVLMGIMIIGAVGMILEKLVKVLEKKLTGWQEIREI